MMVTGLDEIAPKEMLDELISRIKKLEDLKQEDKLALDTEIACLISIRDKALRSYDSDINNLINEYVSRYGKQDNKI